MIISHLDAVAAGSTIGAFVVVVIGILAYVTGVVRPLKAKARWMATAHVTEGQVVVVNARCLAVQPEGMHCVLGVVAVDRHEFRPVGVRACLAGHGRPGFSNPVTGQSPRTVGGPGQAFVPVRQ